MPRPLEVLLALAATALGAAFFASTPYWPKEPQRPLHVPVAAFAAAAPQDQLPSRKAPLLGPSVLAGVRPAPELSVALPDDLAVVVQRRGIDGETGLIPSAASITTFRLRASGDLVSVASSLGVDPVRGDAALTVRGAAAIVSTDRGITTIRWTERGATYEISSRTLDATRLAAVADQLR